MESPAEVIERMRTERGLSQAQAGRLAGVPRSTWSAIESGRSSEPRPATKVRIARALCARPSSIWTRRPRTLHLHDVEDPRWEQAVSRLGSRLASKGTREERLSFGRRLVSVLDRADPGSPDPVSDSGRWQALWRLGASLSLERPQTPIAIVHGRLVERDTTRLGVVRLPAMARDERASRQAGGSPAKTRATG